jgi:hypothetical protein
LSTWNIWTSNVSVYGDIIEHKSDMVQDLDGSVRIQVAWVMAPVVLTP